MLVVWLVGRSVGWLVGWLVGCCPCPCPCPCRCRGGRCPRRPRRCCCCCCMIRNRLYSYTRCFYIATMYCTIK